MDERARQRPEMSAVFISYAAEDRDRARILAQALEQRGWPVWWDREIPLGKAFDEVIEENLARSQCVLVLWSKASVSSRWVRAEASAAAARGVLIPVLLERDVEIPLQFRLLHGADLSDWGGDARHPEFRAFSAHIETMLSAQPEAVAEAETGEGARPALGQPPQARNDAAAARPSITTKAGAGAKLRNALLFILLPTAFIGVATVALMNWHLPTRIQFHLVVERMSFTLAGDQPVELAAQPLTFRVLTVENFDLVRFTPQHFILGAGTGGSAASFGGAGQELTLEGAKDRIPMLNIAGANDASNRAGQLEQIELNPQSEVILQSSIASDQSLMMRVDGQHLRTNVLPAWENLGEPRTRVALDLAATDASLVGPGAPRTDRNPHLREVTLAAYAPTLAIEGTRDTFVITATLDSSEPVPLGTSLRIGKVAFVKQGQGGHPETSLVAPGKIDYPDYPEREPIVLSPAAFVDPGDLQDMMLSRLTLDPKKGGLDLLVEGVAEKSATGAGRDYRLTVFDTMWHGPRTIVVFAILAWVFSISIGVYRLYRDVTKGR